LGGSLHAYGADRVTSRHRDCHRAAARTAERTFYSYTYPVPDGFADYPVGPRGAFYSKDEGEFLLPYEAVRTAANPDKALLEFFRTTYEAAAELGHWDRSSLEVDPGRWDRKRQSH
jgi:hypothetical protein